MAKNKPDWVQTKVSLAEKLFNVAFAVCQNEGLTITEYVDDLIRADVSKRGLWPPSYAAPEPPALAVAEDAPVTAAQQRAAMRSKGGKVHKVLSPQ